MREGCVGEVRVGETQLAVDWSMTMRGREIGARNDPSQPSTARHTQCPAKGSEASTLKQHVRYDLWISVVI